MDANYSPVCEVFDARVTKSKVPTSLDVSFRFKVAQAICSYLGPLFEKKVPI